MRLSYLAVLAPVAGASVLPRQEQPTLGLPSITASPSTVSSACAAASSAAVAAEGRRLLDFDTRPMISARLALDCLMSVPVDVQRDIALLDYLAPYVEFQSTLGYLKKPPAGYLMPGVDVLVAFSEMKQKLSAGGYANQYHFMTELDTVYKAAADGHFVYQPGLLGVFHFRSALQLVSMSSDGLQLPRIYDASDHVNGTARRGASHIVSVNGVPAEDAAAAASTRFTLHDPDASYNSVFNNNKLPRNGRGFYSGFRALPDSFNVTFGNETQKQYANWAAVVGDLRGVRDGQGLHTRFELPESSRPLEKRQLNDKPAVSVPNYPGDPKAINHHGYLHGYFLDAPGQSDTCVLVINRFMSQADSDDEPLTVEGQLLQVKLEMQEARRVTREMISSCKAAGRSRLIIDVQGNGGGLLYLGHEIYRNLFPKTSHWTGSRFRAGEFLGNVLPFLPSQTIETLFGEGSLRLDGTAITKDIRSFFGPAKGIKVDNITEISQYDFAQPDAAGVANFTLSGYDANDPGAPTEAPYKPEDVVVLTDGVCGSTCATLVGSLTREAGVRTVALGGRPLENQPMQAIGAVKGSQVWPVEILRVVFGSMGQLLRTQGANTPKSGLPPLQPTDLSIAASINWRNAYVEDAPEDAPPVQFIYEAAHCRRFYRSEYLADIRSLWTDVRAVAWGGAQCASGSTVNSNGTIGAGGKNNAGTLPYSDNVRSQIKYSGPGAVNGGEAPKGKPPSSAGGPGDSGKPDGSGGDEDKDSGAAPSRAPAWTALLAGAVVAAGMLCM